MAEAATKILPEIAFNRLTIMGRVEYGKPTQNGRFKTLIRTPAPDQYTPPQTVLVYSQSQLGHVGSEIEVRCAVGGRSRTYQKDGQTEQAADCWFNALEN
ncbi:MAG: single-stranded DNA-binding protein [Pseudomonadota bacterium]